MSVIVDYIYNKSLTFNLIVLIQGDTQLGKSTLCKYICDCLSLKKFNKEWEHLKFCARNFGEFLNYVDKYNDKIIVYEECSKDISIDTFYDNINHFFNVILQTQAYKHNTYILVFPQSLSVSNRQRRFIKLGIEVIEKIDEPDLKATIFRPTIYKRTYWRLDEDDLRYIFLPVGYVEYNKEDLEKSKIYTKWLEGTLKKDAMKDIKRSYKRHLTKEKQKEDFKEKLSKKINLKNKIKVKGLNELIH